MRLKFWKKKEKTKEEVELPRSDYGKKFNREQNWLFGLFLLVLFGSLGLRHYLDLWLQQWFFPYASMGLSWLITGFMIMGIWHCYREFKSGQLKKANMYPVIHLLVHLRSGGTYDVHLAIADVKLVKKHKDGSYTYKIYCAYRKGEPFESFILRSKYEYGKLIELTSVEDVFIGFLSVERPTAFLSVKEVGRTKDDLYIVRPVDCVASRRDEALIEMDYEKIHESRKAVDKWEAKEWKEKYEMEKMESETQRSLKEDAYMKAHDFKEDAKEKSDILGDDEKPKKGWKEKLKTTVIIVISALVGAVLAFLILTGGP